MTAFVLIREDQTEHGYVDTSIAGMFHNALIARRDSERRVLLADDSETPGG